jgi:proline dehydrogenase
VKNSLVSFDNTEIAFGAQSDAGLKRAFWLFKIISFNWLVRISPPFVNFALKAKLPVKSIIKKTVFSHFCGGETIEECKPTITKLGKFGIGTILDYSVEGKESEADFNRSLEQTLQTIHTAKDNPHIPFSVFKPTGFARFAILEKKNSNQKLSEAEEKEFNEFLARVELICKTAFDSGVPVFVDAEESWIQDVVDDTVRSMMMKYNRERVMVYNTIQMYRHDRLAFFQAEIQHAKENNYKAGYKIVRGAYMEKERARALRLNYTSPIQPDKSKTDHDYNAALKLAIENLDHVAIVAGTHNEESSLLLTELMQSKNLSPAHPHLYFSQLYGMSDHISYNLAKAGYNVCKYVPYGPVVSVLPYLIRRAQENTSVAGQTGRELSLLTKEIERRKKLRK